MKTADRVVGGIIWECVPNPKPGRFVPTNNQEMKRAAFQPIAPLRKRTPTPTSELARRLPNHSSCPEWCQFHKQTWPDAHFREGICHYCGNPTVNVWPYSESGPQAPKPACDICVLYQKGKKAYRYMGAMARIEADNTARIDALRECRFPQPALELIEKYLRRK